MTMENFAHLKIGLFAFLLLSYKNFLFNLRYKCLYFGGHI